jgi:hypothetical protein
LIKKKRNKQKKQSIPIQKEEFFSNKTLLKDQNASEGNTHELIKIKNKKKIPLKNKNKIQR